jgi:hypothetical protein
LLKYRRPRPLPVGPHYTSTVAEPAHDLDDPPVVDPTAVERAYRRERARRRARVERSRRAKHANVRFWAVLWILLFASAILALTIWSQVQQLFGL